MSRLIVFDLGNRAAGEFHAKVNRGWMLRGHPGVDGENATTVVVPDEVAEQRWLQLGRLVLIEHPTLPPWLGMIDTPWAALSPVEISLYGIEYFFHIRTPESAERVSGPVSQIVARMIAAMNRQESMFLSLGEASDQSAKLDETISQRNVLDQLIPLLERTGHEMVLRPERDEKNRLRVYADIDKRLGFNTKFLLEDGKNMTVLDASVNGEIFNRVKGVSGTSTEEGQLQTQVFEDQDSQNLYRTRSAAVAFSGVTALSTLQEYTKTHLDTVSAPYLEMTVQVYESAFKYLQPGNSVIAHSAKVRLPGGVIGWRGVQRILTMVYNEDNNTVEMKIRGAL